MSKYALFPIVDTDLWDLYKQAVASFWTVEEVDLTQDKEDWNSLTDNEKQFIKNILSFFAISDGIVNANLLMNFANEVTDSASQCFYGFQIAIENIHAEMYSLLIEVYVEDTKERAKLLNGIEYDPSIKKKSKWCLKYTDNSLDFQERIVAFAVVEGIFFSASFCSIFWLKKRNLMHGLSFSNELISRDEGLHTTFACAKYSRGEPLAEDHIHSIITDAVEVECYFVRQSLKSDLIGMNAELMIQYVKFVADYLCVQLNCRKVFNTKNPFPWMNTISLTGKTNFFERRVSEYAKAGVGMDTGEQIFDLNAEF
tara:strand:- start:13171 stop:14106 length:936 start_codon:yes stop_codon:yes gene_type:complete